MYDGRPPADDNDKKTDPGPVPVEVKKHIQTTEPASTDLFPNKRRLSVHVLSPRLARRHRLWEDF